MLEIIILGTTNKAYYSSTVLPPKERIQVEMSTSVSTVRCDSRPAQTTLISA
jgi:hypothetical protein